VGYACDISSNFHAFTDQTIIGVVTALMPIFPIFMVRSMNILKVSYFLKTAKNF